MAGDLTKKLFENGSRQALKALLKAALAKERIELDPITETMIDSATETTPEGFREVWSRADRWLKSFQTAWNLQNRAQAAGIDLTNRTMIYLMPVALGAAEEASSPDKRQMIEDIAFNGALRAEDQAVLAEANEAIETINSLPDWAAVVFAEVVRQLRPDIHAITDQPDFEMPFPRCGLPEPLAQDAQNYLMGQLSIDSRPAGRHALIRQVSENRGTKRPAYVLNDRGYWLGKWISEHPLPKKSAETDGASEDRPAE